MPQSRFVGKTSPAKALANRPFALLWTGQTISHLGDSLYFIALAWWVLEETGSASAMGLVLLCSSVPHLVFLLIGGVAGDRFPRLRIMLGSDLACGLAVALIAVLAWLDDLALWHLCGLGALFGVAGAFAGPAFAAAIPELVPSALLPSANSLRSLGGQASSVVGPALAGVIVAGGGTSLAFTINAVSFLLSALCTAGVARQPSLRRPVAMSSGFLQDMREGIGTVLGTPWLWITIAIAGVSNLTLVGPLATSLPLLVDERFGGRVGAFALLQSLAAAGAIVAAVWLGRFTTLRRRGWLVYGAWLVDALMLMSLGFPAPLVVAAGAMFTFGAAETSLGLVWMRTLQEEQIVPRARLGRVVSIDEFGSYAMLPIGFALAGIASDQIGPDAVFLLGGAIGAGVIALGLLHPAIRSLD